MKDPIPISGNLSDANFEQRQLDCGVEFAADLLPERNTVSMAFRVLSGISDEAPEHNGVAELVEELLPKGTKQFSGRALADAFDAIGAKWGGATGRQSTLFRVACLPEFSLDVIDLIAELLVRPTFPRDACKVAVEQAEQALRRIEDDPDDVIRMLINRLTYGPVFGRWGGGTLESLARLGRDEMVAHWKRAFSAGRVQVTLAGRVDCDAVVKRLEKNFKGWGDSTPAGRVDADFVFTPARKHKRQKLEQEYIAISLPGVARASADFPAEQVLIGVLSGGMSGRLFTEVREKQGLVYSVGAWHEQPRGRGMIMLSASTTPARCDQTYRTLLRELERVSEDLTEAEVVRARDSLVAHAMTEDDLTAARNAGISDDLFHFGKPIGAGPKIAAVKRITLADVRDYAKRLRRDRVCVATLGEKELG